MRIVRVGDASLVDRSTTVKDVMTPDPMTLTPEATVGEAHALMKENGFRHVPVMEGESLVGILSMTDIGHLGATIPAVRSRIVGEVMTRKPFTISCHERVEVAAAQMAVRKVHCLLVVDAEKLVGIVTTYDLLDALARDLRTQ